MFQAFLILEEKFLHLLYLRCSFKQSIEGKNNSGGTKIQDKLSVTIQQTRRSN